MSNVKGTKLYGFSVKMATEEDIPFIQDITKDAFLKYIKEAGLTNIEALNEMLERVKKAQVEYEQFTQEQVDRIFKAAATAADKARMEGRTPREYGHGRMRRYRCRSTPSQQPVTACSVRKCLNQYMCYYVALR